MRYYYPMFGAVLDTAPSKAEAERDEREAAPAAPVSDCPVTRADFAQHARTGRVPA